MKPLHLLAATLGTLALLASPATAQDRPVGGVPRITIPPPTFHPGFPDGALKSAPPNQNNLFSWERGSGFHGGFGNVWVVEREVPVVVREVVQAPPPQAVPLPQNPGGGAKERKPYVLGASYASLPGSCMKMIEDGVSFYYCSGDWYRQEGKSYRAVSRKL